MPRANPLPAAIVRCLSTFERRRRLELLKRGLCESLVAFIALFVTVAALDWILQPTDPWRIALGIAAYAATGLVLCTRIIANQFPFLRRVQVARELELLAGEDGRAERISSAVALAGQQAAARELGVSEWMIDQTIASAAGQAAGMDAAALIDRAPARRARLHAAGIAFLAIALLLTPGAETFARRALLPWSAIARPSSATLVVVPGNGLVADGAAFELQAQVTPSPESATVSLRWDDGYLEEWPMERADDPPQFRTVVPAVTRGFTYTVQALDAQSPRFRVEVVKPPTLAGWRLSVAPPSYVSSPRFEVAGGDAKVLAGSRITFIASFEHAIEGHAAIIADDKTQYPLAVAGNSARCELTASKSFSYGLRLTTPSGLDLDLPGRWEIEVDPDAAPTADLTVAGLEAGLVGADEVLLALAQAHDDLGVARLDLVVTDADGYEHRRPLPVAYDRPPGPGRSARAVRVPVTIDLGDLGASVGGLLRLELQATDVAGQTARSEPLELAITDTADARVAALAAWLSRRLTQFDEQLALFKAAAESWNRLASDSARHEATERRGVLTYLQRDVERSLAALGNLGGELRQEAASARPDVASLLDTVGRDIQDWSALENDILSGALQSALAAAQADVVPEVVRGKHLHAGASSDLDALRSQLGNLAARIESVAMLSRSRVSYARAVRTLPIARGGRGWLPASHGAAPAAKQADTSDRLPREMSYLPANVLGYADQRLAGDATTLADVPASIGRMAQAVGDAALKRLSDTNAPVARQLHETAKRAGDWSLQDLATIEEHAGELLRAAEEAQRMVANSLHQWEHQLASGGEIEALRRRLLRVRQRAESLLQEDSGAGEVKLEDSLRRQHMLADAHQQQFAWSVTKLIDKVHSQAMREGASLAERAAALEAAGRLEDLSTHELERAVQAGTGPSAQPEKFAKAMIDALDKLHRELQPASQAEHDTARQRSAHAAGQARRAAALLAEKSSQADRELREQARRNLEQFIAEIVAADRSHGDFASAEKLDQHLDSDPELTRIDPLARELDRRARQARQPSPGALTQHAARQLDRQLQRIASAGRPIDASAEARRLTGPQLALAVEAELRLANHQQRPAVLHYQLAKDVLSLQQRSGDVNSQTLRPLVERAKALAGDGPFELARENDGRQGVAAQDALSRDLEDAKQLEALAQQALSAAKRADERDDLTRRLQELAQAGHAVAPTNPDHTDPLADMRKQLEELLQAMQQQVGMSESEKAARQAFAEAERTVAGSTRNLVTKARAELDKSAGGETTASLDRLAGNLPRTAQKLDELSQAAAAQTAKTADLVRGAREIADQLELEVSRSFAKSFRDAVRKNDAGHPLAGSAAVGRELAGLAAQQRLAAENLQRAMAEWVKQQQQQIEQMARNADGLQPDQPERSSAASKALRLAEADQAKADRLQRQADRYWQQAAESIHQAERTTGSHQERENKLARDRFQRATAGQSEAVSAQQDAIDATGRALSTGEADDWSSMVAVVGNLRRALENSKNADGNSLQAQRHRPADPLANANRQAAQRNSEAAQQALAMLAQRAAQMGQQMADSMQQSAAQNDAAPPDQPKDSQSASSSPAESQSQPSKALSQAAAQALQSVNTAPQQPESYQQAAQTLSQAAQQSRLTDATRGDEAPESDANPQDPSDQTADSKAVAKAAGRGQVDGEGGEAAELPPAPDGIDQADWARLPPELKKAIQTAAIESFAEEHRQAIRAYFRRLGAERE